MPFEATLEFARKQDKKDLLSGFRKQFHFPKRKGEKLIYFCGHGRLGSNRKIVAKAIKQN